MNDPEYPKYDEEEEKERKGSIKPASDLVHTFSKAGKTLKIYPESSPVRQKIIDETIDKFTRFLDQFGELTLRIKQFEISYNDEVVYSNPSKEDSLAFRFFGDGIREIRFTVGIEEKEILGFMDVISRNYSMEGQDNDIATLLWEKDFKNIHHTVVDYGEDQNSETAALKENIPTGTEGRNFHALYHAEVPEETLETGDKPLLTTAGSAEVDIEAIYKKPINEIFILTQEEIARIQHEMEMEDGLYLMSELLDILFHVLQIENEIDVYSEILKSIIDAIKSSILAGDYPWSIPILSTLRILAKDENNFSPAHAKEVQSAIDSLGEEQFLHQLHSSIIINKITDFIHLSSFLTMLNSNAIESISNMAGTVEQIKIRRFYCDVLGQLAKDNIEPLIKILGDNNWYVVRNIVYVLGKIGSTEAVKYLRRIKNHTEPRVRKEIVHAVSEINCDAAKDFLIYYLDDKDSSVRLTALQNIAIHQYRKAVPTIFNIITGESFNAKDANEKKELFETLGMLGSIETLTYLKNILTKRAGFFTKSRIDEQRTYAALALKKMATSESLAILRDGLSHPDKTIRRICEEVLKEY